MVDYYSILLCINFDTTDGHYSFIIDSSTTTQLIDHTTTGFEMQMKALLSENSSLEFNLLSTDSEIAVGEALFDPLNINGATTTIGAPVGAAGLGNMLLSNCLAAVEILLPVLLKLMLQ